MILVTGATGLVGSHLLYQLTLDNTLVKATYRSEKTLKKVKHVFSYFSDNVEEQFSKILWIKADVTDIPSIKEAFVDVDIVYHVAALVSFNPKEYKVMRQINIEGTANIVNYCISNEIKKLCFVSSIAAIGEPINGKTIVTEENEWNSQASNSGYSITKHGAEMEVWRASQEGVDVIIVNPGVVLGAGFWKVNTGQIFSRIASGFRFYSTGITGFVGVNDVVKAMVELTNSEVKNQRFILVSENKSFKQILAEISKKLHKKPPSIKISKIVASIFYPIDFLITFLTRKPPLITKEMINSLQSTTYYSSDKIEKQIKFEFTPIKEVIKQVSILYKKDFDS